MGKSAAVEVVPPVIPIDRLAADPINPRTISDEALAGLEASVGEFGDLSGVVFNQRTGQLITGHQRVTALKRAGAKDIEVDASGRWFIRHPQTGESFPVRVVDWTEDAQRLANFVANNPAIAGEFTSEALEQLKDLEESVHFESLRLDELQARLTEDLEALEAEAEPADGNTDPDEAPEPPAVPVTKPGDLWILGDHKLLCGDSTKAEDVARLMDGKKAMLFATDPPYGVDYTATKAGMPISGLGDAQDRWGDIENDDLKGDGLGDFLVAMLKAAAEHLADRHASYVWHPSGELNHEFRKALLAGGYVIHRQIIWKKPGFVLTRSGMYHWAHETCFYGWRQGNVPPWYGEKNQTSVWEVGRDDGKAVHPTQKPVALFEIPMANHTRKGEVCYEPFSGSGSQIIAGERLGRRVFAMEMSPRWVDAAVKRWQSFTGKDAECHHADGTKSAHGIDDVNF